MLTPLLFKNAGIENPRVRGSIPRPGTNILKTQPLWLGFCFLKHQ